MLKKIEVRQLRLGMYLHAFEGAWVDHPFWRTRFVIDDDATLHKAQASGVRECWIDAERGLDVVDPGANTVAVASAAPVLPVPALEAAPQRAPPAARTSMREEMHQAAAVCKQGRQAVMSMFADARLGRALDAEQCLPLVEQISDSVYRNPGALVSLARLKTKDDYSYMHSVAVCALMVALGRQLGLPIELCRRAGLAGLLHDLGKALMPPEVLNKPGKLSEDEFAIMRTHPLRGHELLHEGRGTNEDALDVCLHHHERIDGKGYPHGLADGQIVPLTRMSAVCDVYDAITSNRPYKPGWDPAESIARMVSWKGHFDEQMLAAFVKSIGIYPTGSLVRMASGRIGVVVEQNHEKLSSPVVKLFYSTKAGMPITPVSLDLAQAASSDRIVGREPNDRWGFKQFDDLWLDPEVRRASR